MFIRFIIHDNDNIFRDNKLKTIMIDYDFFQIFFKIYYNRL